MLSDETSILLESRRFVCSRISRAIYEKMFYVGFTRRFSSLRLMRISCLLRFMRRCLLGFTRRFSSLRLMRISCLLRFMRRCLLGFTRRFSLLRFMRRLSSFPRIYEKKPFSQIYEKIVSFLKFMRRYQFAQIYEKKFVSSDLREDFVSSDL